MEPKKEIVEVTMDEWEEAMAWEDENEDKFDGPTNDRKPLVPESEIPPVVLKAWTAQREFSQRERERSAIMRSLGLDDGSKGTIGLDDFESADDFDFTDGF